MLAGIALTMLHQNPGTAFDLVMHIWACFFMHKIPSPSPTQSQTCSPFLFDET